MERRIIMGIFNVPSPRNVNWETGNLTNSTVLAMTQASATNSSLNYAIGNGGNVLVGYWFEWWPQLPLEQIPWEYNVISVAFMQNRADGIPTFAPQPPYTDATFRAAVDAIKAQGRAVLISLGGATGHTSLRRAQKDAFRDEIIRLCDVYGFNGFDINLENISVNSGDNQEVVPQALIEVKDSFRARGQEFFICMAPEFPYLRTAMGGNSYIPYLQKLEGYYDLIYPQYYNQAGDGISTPNGWIPNNGTDRQEDFLFYLTDAFIKGEQGFFRIPPDKFAIGLPSSRDAFYNGGLIENPQDVYNAFRRLDNQGTPIRGLMTWSINQDANNGWPFLTSYRDLIFGNPTHPPVQPPAPPPVQPPGPVAPATPTNLYASDVSTDGVDLGWSHPGGAVRYDIYRGTSSTNFAFIGSSSTIRYFDHNVVPGAVYHYYVVAVDSLDHTSMPSNTITVNIPAITQPPVQPPNICDITPLNVRVINPTSNSLTVVWDNPVSASGIVNYEVFRNGIRVGEVPVNAPNSFIDSGLAAGTQYTYTVRSHATSSHSNIATGQTQPGMTPPPPPIEPPTPGQGVVYRIAGEGSNRQTLTIINRAASGFASGWRLEFDFVGTPPTTEWPANWASGSGNHLSTTVNNGLPTGGTVSIPIGTGANTRISNVTANGVPAQQELVPN